MSDPNVPNWPEQPSPNPGDPFATPQQPTYSPPQQGYGPPPGQVPPQQPNYPPQQQGYGPPPGQVQPGYQPPGFYGQAMGALNQDTPASFWGKRAVALIIDWAVMLIPNGIIYFILAAIFLSTAAPSATTTYLPNGQPYVTYHAGAAGMSIFLFMFIMIIVIALLNALYFAYLDSATIGTVGKRVMKIKVVDVATGERPNLVMAGLRMFIYWVLFAPCYLPGILNALWPLWGADGRAWHDLATKTKVVSSV